MLPLRAQSDITTRTYTGLLKEPWNSLHLAPPPAKRVAGPPTYQFGVPLAPDDGVRRPAKLPCPRFSRRAHPMLTLCADYYGPEWRYFSVAALTSFARLEKVMRGSDCSDAEVAAATEHAGEQSVGTQNSLAQRLKLRRFGVSSPYSPRSASIRWCAIARKHALLLS